MTLTTAKFAPMLLVFLFLLASGRTRAAQSTAPPTPASSGTVLAQQAADPTAPLMAFNLKDEYKPSFYRLRNSGNSFIFQPVIPFGAWHKANLLRATISYDISGPLPTDLDSDASSSDSRGLDSVSVFDLIVFNKKWGRWGLGPLVNFAPNEGAGKDTTTAALPSASSHARASGMLDCSIRICLVIPPGSQAFSL